MIGKIRALRAVSGCALALAVSTPCSAAPLLGLSFASSEYKYEDVGRGTGYKLFGAYRFDEHPIMLEIDRLDLGKASINDYTDSSGNSLRGTKLGWSGYNFSVGLYGGKPSPLEGWLKVGYATGDSTLSGRFNGTPFDTSEKSSSITWGLGGDWMFSRRVGLVLDLEGMSKMKDLPRLDSSHTSSVTIISFGLIVTFQPGPEASSASSRSPEAQEMTPPPEPPPAAPAPVVEQTPPPAPAPKASEPPPPAEPTPATPPPEAEPVTPTPAPAAEPAPSQPPSPAPAPAPAPAPPAAAPSPAPAAPPAAAAPVAPATLAVGGHAKLRAGTSGRNRATADGTPVAGLDAGATVTLKATMENASGTWWYVSGPGASGWARAQDLEPQP